MSRNFKNILELREKAFGQERRRNIAKEMLKDSTPFPSPLQYKDIDEEFKKFVEEELDISFGGERIPTIALYSNQRFSEYMQSWASVDNKKNLILNFKAITRENNPKGGSILGNTRNIPGERRLLMQRVEKQDSAGRTYYEDYMVKQPFAIDMLYTISIVTNKYELLNAFNEKVNDKFKAIDCYIRPKGHFIPMKLTDISDESEYSLDNRQFYSQSYSVTVMAYIIPEDSYEVIERPKLTFLGFDGDGNKNTYAEIEDLPCGYKEPSPFGYQPINITIHFDPCDSSYKFNLDTDFNGQKIELENVRSFRFFVNDVETELDENIKLKKGDNIKVKGVKRINPYKNAEIIIQGYSPRESIMKES